MRGCAYSLADLLPHAPPMILLDAVTGWQPGTLTAAVEIRSTSPFYQVSAGVPAHVGIEYMAQACGAYAGLESKEAGAPVRIGYLLGTRRYVSSASWFRLGERLVINVVEVLRDGPMGVFDCRITIDDREIATARLTVYQPINGGDLSDRGDAA